MSRDPRTMVHLVNVPPPTKQGRFGRAWDRSQFSIEGGDPNDWMATVASWVISSTCFHPFWDAWNIYAVSLKDIPGVRPAKKHFPEAEWEIGIVSVEPGTTIDLGNPKGSVRLLAPVDLVHQVLGISADEVREIVTDMITMIVEKGISPDSDNRQEWKVFIDLRVRESQR